MRAFDDIETFETFVAAELFCLLGVDAEYLRSCVCQQTLIFEKDGSVRCIRLDKQLEMHFYFPSDLVYGAMNDALCLFVITFESCMFTLVCRTLFDTPQPCILKSAQR